jgi:uncharacterized protein
VHYPGPMTSFDLRRLRLRPGEEHREAVEVELPALELGGERYLPVPENVVAELVVTRAVTGNVFELAFQTRLHGPCFRCLGDAVLDLPIRAREYQASAPDDEELRTPYVVHDVLDVSGWARDAVALALPDKILCRPDCAGLCPECGKNLNDEPHGHEQAGGDPRWQALEALRDGEGDGPPRDRD